MDLDYHIYIQKVDTDTTEPVYDLERHFRTTTGELKYRKCEGLNKKGKKKSVYTESYADSDKLRIWESDDLTREATTITLDLLFVGEDKQRVYDTFYEYIKKGNFLYTDDVRYKLAYITLIDALEPSEEKFVGSTTYYEAQFKFQNLWGGCKDGRQYINNLRNTLAAPYLRDSEGKYVIDSEDGRIPVTNTQSPSSDYNISVTAGELDRRVSGNLTSDPVQGENAKISITQEELDEKTAKRSYSGSTQTLPDATDRVNDYKESIEQR